ncbi:hypothetical protein D3C78_1705900 [compost metagenome]
MMRSSSAGGKAFTVSSAMKPGDTRFTVTPRAATSCASDRVKPITAPLAVA